MPVYSHDSGGNCVGISPFKTRQECGFFYLLLNDFLIINHMAISLYVSI